MKGGKRVARVFFLWVHFLLGEEKKEQMQIITMPLNLHVFRSKKVSLYFISLHVVVIVKIIGALYIVICCS